MRSTCALLWLLGAWLVPDPRLCAQETPADQKSHERIELSVTAVAGNNVFLDAGSNAGLEVGDRVRLLPLGGASLEGTIRIVSSQASRAEFPQGLAGVQVGDRAEAYVPASRRAAQPEQVAPAKDVPAHPPWETPAEDWPEDMPLLAPVEARGPEDRPRSVRGSAYTRGEWRADREDDSDSSYLWVGGDLEVDNPFGRGGELNLDLDAYTRQFDGEEDSDDESHLRVERLSYSEGGVRGRPQRFEVGRFMQQGVPELGTLDGVEWERRLPSGDAFGLSLGFLPAWDDEMTSGDNLAVSAFYRYVGDDQGTLASTLGLQKTWFKGAADRDLLVWSADYRPLERTFLHGSAWVDFYSGGDDRSGAELTQAVLTATQDFESGSGLGLTATHYAFPDLLRDDLFTATEEELLDTEVSRVSVRGWQPLSDELTLNARASAFSDQDDSGVSYELGLLARDLLYERGSVSLDVYDIEGKYTSGTGVRAAASKSFASGDVRLELDITDYDVSDSESLAHDRARIVWERIFGAHWSFALSAEERFGDQQSSSTLGFFIQRRF